MSGSRCRPWVQTPVPKKKNHPEYLTNIVYVHWDLNSRFSYFDPPTMPPFAAEDEGGWGCKSRVVYSSNAEKRLLLLLVCPSAFWSCTPSISAMFKARNHCFLCQVPYCPDQLAVRAKLILSPVGCLSRTHDLWTGAINPSRRPCRGG
jgi:hypothetical protein